MSPWEEFKQGWHDAGKPWYFWVIIVVVSFILAGLWEVIR
jgi:hypothetical protein